MARCSGLSWRKSSYSGTQSCVEVALADDRVLVRDSKTPDDPVLQFTHEEWRAFLSGVKDGEFDV